MNRQQAKELLPIIQAFAEGKTIQYYYEHTCPHWIDINDSAGFNDDTLKYRIKPEPKYRPFKNVNECWNEMLKHQPFGWVKNKHMDNNCYIIDGVFYATISECPVVSMAGESFNYEEMITDYLFADGTPFGIKE